jgi:hypothetical protein
MARVDVHASAKDLRALQAGSGERTLSLFERICLQETTPAIEFASGFDPATTTWVHRRLPSALTAIQQRSGKPVKARMIHVLTKADEAKDRQIREPGNRKGGGHGRYEHDTDRVKVNPRISRRLVLLNTVHEIIHAELPDLDELAVDKMTKAIARELKLGEDAWSDQNPMGVSKQARANTGWVKMPLRRRLKIEEPGDPERFEEAKKVRLSKAESRALEYYADKTEPDFVINFPWRVHPTLSNLVSKKLLREIPHPKYTQKRRYEITSAGKAALGLTEQSPAKVPGSGWLTLHYPAGTGLEGQADIVVGGGQNPDEVRRIKDALRWVFPAKRVLDLPRRKLKTRAK